MLIVSANIENISGSQFANTLLFVVVKFISVSTQF